MIAPLTTAEVLTRVEEIVHDLMGTCKSLTDVATEDEAIDSRILERIDDEIFCCAQCEWWCEVGEAVESSDPTGDICRDCADGSDDDDDYE